jgi:hypothetical protein
LLSQWIKAPRKRGADRFHHTELGHERAITATLRRLATERSLKLQQAREELAARTNVTRTPTRSTAVIGSCS